MHDNRLAGFQHLEPGFALRLGWRNGDPLTMFDQIEIMDKVVLRFIPADADVAGSHYFKELFTNQVDDGLEIHLGCQPLLNTVNDRQLSGAFFGHFQQTLGFIEQAGIFERNPHAVGDGFQEAGVGIAEGIFAFHIREVNQPADLVAYQQRHKDGGFLSFGSWQQEGVIFLNLMDQILINNESLFGLSHVAADPAIVQRDGINRNSNIVLKEVNELIQMIFIIKDADGQIIVVEDFANLVAHRIINALDVEFSCQGRLNGVDDG